MTNAPSTNRQFWAHMTDRLAQARQIHGWDHPASLRLEYLDQRATERYLAAPEAPAALAEGTALRVAADQAAQAYAESVAN